VTSIPDPIASSTPEQSGGIIQHSNGKCLDNEGPSSANGASAQIWDCVGVDQQSFVAVKVSNGDFKDRWRRATADESLCFSPSSCRRKDEVDGIRSALIFSSSTNPNVLTHNTIGSFLDSLAQDPGLSTTERAYIWNSVATTSNAIIITGDGAHPLVKDHLLPLATRQHTIVPFYDGYHGDLVDLSLQDAFDRIWEHEFLDGTGCETTVPCPNFGDIEASTRQVIALQRFEETMSFVEFSTYWNGLMRSDGENLCPRTVWKYGCSAVNAPALG